MRPTADHPTSSGAVEPDLGRTHLLALASAMMALVALAVDLMLPAFDDIRETFDLRDGSADVGKVVTFFFFGLAAAQLVYGPLADRFGRKPTLYLGIAVYTVGALGSALAPSFGFLLASRFVWGLGAAGARVVAVAVVRDHYEGAAMASAMSQVMAVFILVPVIAPLLGAGVVAIAPWRGVFWICLVFAAAVTAWSLRLDETLDPAEVRPLTIASTWAGLREVVLTRTTAWFTIASVFLHGAFTAYLASGEVIIGDILGWERQFPWAFGAVAALFVVAAIANGRVVGRFGVDRAILSAIAFIVPMSALLLAVSATTNGHPSPWVFMPLLGPIIASFMFLLPSLSAVAMTPMGHIAGTASAITGAMRVAMGAALGTVVANAVVDSTTPFAFAIAAMVAAAIVSIAVGRLGAGGRPSVPVDPSSAISGFDVA